MTASTGMLNMMVTETTSNIMLTRLLCFGIGKLAKDSVGESEREDYVLLTDSELCISMIFSTCTKI